MDYRIFENLLKTNNMTVYRVAKETGIPASTFSDWKSGRSLPKADKLKRIASLFDVSIEYFMGGAGDGSAELEKKIPVVRKIKAGCPIITEDNLVGYEYANVDNSYDYFYLKTSDDSMRGAGIVAESLILFRKQQYADDGNIVSCLIGEGDAIVRRFHRHQKNITLSSENDSYPTISLSTDDFESGEARILGIAIEVKTKLI